MIASGLNKATVHLLDSCKKIEIWDNPIPNIFHKLDVHMLDKTETGSESKLTFKK